MPLIATKCLKPRCYDEHVRGMRSRVTAFWLATTVAAVACGRSVPRHERLNVLVITIDTFRADRLGVGVAPALDRLAASAVRFTAARTAVPLTLPSHTTILTGLLPPAHGVRQNGVDRLDDSHPTLATLLKGAGYETAAFVGAFVLDRQFGLSRGFDTYDDQIPRDPAATDRLEAERPASVVVERALAWLDTWSTRHTSAPFCVWLHLYDPHAPYTPPPEYRAKTSTPYDGEIAYADAQIARVLDWLRAKQVTDNTLIVVAGDHGEGLGEHGERTHGMLVYDSTLRVPLIVAAPAAHAEQRSDAVSLAEIAPTVLHAAGVSAPAQMKGRDLLGGFGSNGGTGKTNQSTVAGMLYSETEYPRVAGWSTLQAFTDGRWKTIRAGGSSEVYDLHGDPGEQHDLSSSQPNVAIAMGDRIRAVRAAAARSGSRTVSPEAERRLRSLGYVATPSSASDDSTAPNPASKIAEWNAFEDALSLLNGHRPEALAALEPLAKRNPDAPVIQTTFARALKDAGRLDRALVVYRDAARRWSTDATVLHDLAVAARDAAARATGSTAAALRDEASRAEQAAITLAPDSAMAHNGLGLLAADAGRAQDAAREFQRAADLDPNSASYWTNLGNARRSTGDRAGAEQAYRRALDVNARDVDAANGLGVLLVEAERPADAVPLLERVVETAPDFVEARLNLGIALQQSGQTARAADVYRAVLSAPPRFAREREAASKLLASLK
jgi:choline-sulfatase